MIGQCFLLFEIGKREIRRRTILYKYLTQHLLKNDLERKKDPSYLAYRYIDILTSPPSSSSSSSSSSSFSISSSSSSSSSSSPSPSPSKPVPTSPLHSHHGPSADYYNHYSTPHPPPHAHGHPHSNLPDSSFDPTNPNCEHDCPAISVREGLEYLQAPQLDLPHRHCGWKPQKKKKKYVRRVSKTPRQRTCAPTSKEADTASPTSRLL